MKYFLFAFFIFQGQLFSQQLNNLFEATYIFSPNSADFDYQKSEVKFNYPQKLGKGLLVNSIEFAHHNLNYNEEYMFELSDIGDFYEIGYAVLYSHPLKKRWRLTARFNPQIISNLQGSLTKNDVLLNGNLIATKKWGALKKGSSLSFGFLYAPISGRQSLLPYIRFNQILNEQFSYGIGFPNTYLRYNLSTKNNFELGLKIYGLNANLSGNNSPEFNGTDAQKIQFVNLNANFSYSRFVTEAWKINFNAGYSLFNQYVLADSGQEEVYNFDIGNRPFFSIGVSYDLQRAKNKKSRQ